jgi:hypothetical protein
MSLLPLPLSPSLSPSLPLYLPLSLTLLSQSLSNASRDEAGVKLLHEYYNQLSLVAKRFIHPSMKHGLAFIWYVVACTLSIASFPSSILRATLKVWNGNGIWE